MPSRIGLRWRPSLAEGHRPAPVEFVARQTVGVGDLPFVDEQPAVEAALDRAQAGDVVGRLENGLSTQLGKSYTDGTELSGGAVAEAGPGQGDDARATPVS